MTIEQQMIELLTEQNQILSGHYAVSLFAVGVLGALLVLFLMYKFLKLFY